ncbi:MAG TPA: homoserine dehydrogenase [Candidatus Limnocylindria bacterium]|nr:homoserine dehydrogenase [Candidatus Limnocylindria bacterium]
MDGDRLRIGLIGWGTVGSALGELVQTGPLPLTLACLAIRNPDRPDLPKGIELVAPEEALDADVVVELAGGIDGPLEWARAALDRGTPYVTANKALLATHGGELAELASRRVAALLGSASVGGGTPMIETTEHLAATGAIERIRGIVNATTTYILSAMGDGRTYDEALRAAQDAGYAEADPSFDVDGRDAAQKLAILASVAWGKWRAEREVDTTGIVGRTVQAGETVRLVAEATKDSMTVSPMPLDPADPLARTSGVESMLEITVADAGVFRVSGPGAGGRVTAGAVYADLARLVNGERPILFGSAS